MKQTNLDLLAVDDDENPEIDAGQVSLMAMIIKTNDNMNSVLTPLSRVEATQGKPAAKKRRIAAVTDTVDDDSIRVNYQKTLVVVGVALTQSTEVVLSIQAKQSNTSADPELKHQLGELVTYNTDALAMLGHIHIELLTCHWELIKSNLNKEYSSLCSPQTPITELLFGDDLQLKWLASRQSIKLVRQRLAVRNLTLGVLLIVQKNRTKEKPFPPSRHSNSIWRSIAAKNQLWHSTVTIWQQYTNLLMNIELNVSELSTLPINNEHLASTYKFTHEH